MKNITSKENSFAFIDSQNLNLSIKSQGWLLDFKKFRAYLSDRFSVDRAYLFVGFIKENLKLYAYLEKVGYIVIFKPILKLPNDKFKGNVDAELVLHSMIHCNNYDKAVIVSGDGDFHCLVYYFLKNNKLKRLIVPNRRRYSSLLRVFIEYISFLNGTKDKLSKTKKKHRLGTKPFG